jgi:hypothetical protein
MLRLSFYKAELICKALILSPQHLLSPVRLRRSSIMSGVEVVGALFSVASVAITALSAADFRSAYSPPVTSFYDRVREDGLLMTLLLRTVLTDALGVMDRVERYVIHADDAHVLAFMKSYTSSFNIIGVAVSTKEATPKACIDF